MFGLVSASECKILILPGAAAGSEGVLVAVMLQAGVLGAGGVTPSLTNGLRISQLSRLVPVSFSGLENRGFKCLNAFPALEGSSRRCLVSPRGLGVNWSWDI